MKKVVALLLTMCMCISFVGCGDKKENNNDVAVGDAKEQATSNSNITVEISEEGYQTITFRQPLVLVDDEYAKVEILKLYEEYTNWADQAPAVEKHLSLRIQNKTTDRILAWFENFSINGREAKDAYCFLDEYPEGRRPLAGETTLLDLGVRYPLDDETHEPLNALEDLYDLKGELGLKVYVANTSYTVPFSLRDYIEQQ